VDALDDLPLLPGILELVGIAYSAWFVKRYLWRAANRQELWEMLASAKTYVIGEAKPGENQEAIAPPSPKFTAPVTPEVPHIQPAIRGNGVDELRYLFIASQVEVVDSPEPLKGVEYRSEADFLGVAVVKAQGEKCDRCWNYSTHIGESPEDPTICERCVAALAGEF
jgi:isoleucyl-tRNA synthetase